jgi:hypothetical protein
LHSDHRVWCAFFHGAAFLHGRFRIFNPSGKMSRMKEEKKKKRKAFVQWSCWKWWIELEKASTTRAVGKKRSRRGLFALPHVRLAAGKSSINSKSLADKYWALRWGFCFFSFFFLLFFTPSSPQAVSKQRRFTRNETFLKTSSSSVVYRTLPGWIAFQFSRGEMRKVRRRLESIVSDSRAYALNVVARIQWSTARIRLMKPVQQTMGLYGQRTDEGWKLSIEKEEDSFARSWC